MNAKGKRKLSTKIARKLFTPGGLTKMVDHLVLKDNGKEICGWAFDPAVEAIHRVIEDHLD